MSISVHWDEEFDDLLCLVITDSPKARELYDLIQSLYQTIDTKQTPVDLLVEIDRTCELPQGFFSVINHFERRRHANMRLLVVVTSHPMMRLIRNILSRAEHISPYLSDTIENARLYIRQYRDQLDEDS